MLIPRPVKLSKAETNALILAAQAGDTKARDRVVEANLSLAEHWAVRVAMSRDLRGDDLEDIVQLASMALVKAIRAYRADGRATFGTFASRVIINSLSQRVNLQSRKRDGAEGALSLDYRQTDDDTAIGDRIADETACVTLEAGDMAQAVRERVAGAGLSARETVLVEMRWLSGREATLHEVGQHLGFSRQYAKQVEDKAIAKLRRELAPLAREVA